jgi:hypothetical protein
MHNLPPSPYPATASYAQDETPRQEPKTPIQILRPAARTEKLALRVCLPTDRVSWSGKETPVSDMTLKYPLWQNQYLQAMVETRPELLKSKISAAEQVVSQRLRLLASTTDDYEEQIALAAALESLKVLKER